MSAHAEAIQPISIGRFEFIELPPLGWLGIPVAMVLVLLLVLLFIGAVIPALLPGPVGRAERTRSKAVSFVGATLRLFGLAAILAGGTATQFPLSRPIVVVLGSATASTETSAWRDGWAAAVQAYRPKGRVVDAATLTGPVFDALIADPWATGWDRDDRATIEHIRLIVDRTLSEHIGDFGLQFERPEDIEPKQEQRLPAWVVESVEIATLKALTQRRNVAGILVVYEPRTTELGRAWHPGIEAFLRSDARRFYETDVRLHDLGDPPPVRFAGLDAVRDGEGIRYVMTFQIHTGRSALTTDKEWETLSTVTVHRQGGEQLTRFELDIDPTVALQSFSEPVEAEPGDRLVFVQVGTGSFREITVPILNADYVGEVQDSAVRIVARESRLTRWRVSLERLGVHDAFRSWRASLKDELLNPLSADAVSSSENTAVEIHDMGGFVWVGRTEPPVDLVSQSKDLSEPKYATRVALARYPSSVYGWAAIQLSDTPTPDCDWYRYGDEITMLRTTQRLKYVAASAVEKDRPLEIAVTARDYNGQTYRATILAIDPIAVGALLDASGEPEDTFHAGAFLAFHTSLVRAVRRAQAPALDLREDFSPNSVGEDAVVLTTPEIAGLMRSQRFISGVQIAGFGLTIFSVGIIFSINTKGLSTSVRYRR